MAKIYCYMALSSMEGGIATYQSFDYREVLSVADKWTVEDGGTVPVHLYASADRMDLKSTKHWKSVTRLQIEEHGKYGTDFP